MTAGAFCIPPKFAFLVVLGFAVHLSVVETYIRVVTFSTTTLCFRALFPRLVNSVYIQDGTERAKIVKNTRPMPTSRHLKDLQICVKDKIGFVSLDTFREYDGSEKKDFDPYWVVHSMRGVALVLIAGYHGVDYLVCVDANARKIYYNMEEKPLKLCVDALKTCCGDESDMDQIVECSKVTVYCRSAKAQRTRRGLSDGQKNKRA